MLKSRGFAGPRDDFEKVLLFTLRGPVVTDLFAYRKPALTCEDFLRLIRR